MILAVVKRPARRSGGVQRHCHDLEAVSCRRGEASQFCVLCTQQQEFPEKSLMRVVASLRILQHKTALLENGYARVAAALSIRAQPDWANFGMVPSWSLANADPTRVCESDGSL